MTRKHLEAAERLAVEVAPPLPAIMTLMDGAEDANRPAIAILLRTVNDRAGELADALFRLRQELEPLTGEARS